MVGRLAFGCVRLLRSREASMHSPQYDAVRSTCVFEYRRHRNRTQVPREARAHLAERKGQTAKRTVSRGGVRG